MKLTSRVSKGSPLTYVEHDENHTLVHQYFCDPDETDQGLSGDGNTLNAHITTIGSDTATIYFPAGAYTLTTPETVPSNITLKFDAGAVIDGAGTLTGSDAKLEIGLTQAFGSSITVAGTWNVREGYPQWFGAVGDGVTDDTAAIQASIDFFEPFTYGGTVFFKSGVYIVSSGLTVGSHYITLQGDGHNTASITRASGFTTGYTVTFSRGGGANAISWCAIANLQFVTEEAMTSGGHILLDVARSFRIDHCNIREGFTGIHCKSTGAFWIQNTQIKVGSLYPEGVAEAYAYLFFDTDETASIPRNGGYVLNCNFRSEDDGDSHVEHGVIITSADGIWFNQTHIGQTSSDSIYCLPKNGTAQMSGINIENCWFDGCTGVGLRFGGESTDTYGYNSVFDCFFTGGNAGSEAIAVGLTSGVMSNFSISDCFIVDWIGNGISIDDCTNFSISGCNIRDVASISGNGITIGSLCTNYRIQNCGVGFQQDGTGVQGADYGLVLDGDGYIVTGNDFRGNTTGSIYDSGISGAGIIKDNLVDISSSIASATTVTLPVGLDFFNITGTTNITTINVTFADHIIILKFADILTVNDGTGNIELAGDLVTTAGDTLTLICDGTDWHEVSRSVN